MSSNSTVDGEYRVEDLFRCRPRYAVVHIEPENDVVQLFKDLLTAGYKSVRFFDDLSHHPSIRENSGSMIRQQPTRAIRTTKLDIPSLYGETPEDFQKPTTFQVQITEKVATKKSHPHDYDHTIDQVIGKISIDPNALVSNLFSYESASKNSKKAAKDEPGPDEFVKCRLCDSRIMATRHSNLVNHVRRHSSTKQFQCAHCSYQNNEQAKVRLHMQNQHSDSSATIIDKYNSEMEEIWEQLLTECFPNFNETLSNAKAAQARRLAAQEESAATPPSPAITPISTAPSNDGNSYETVQSLRNVAIYRCLECPSMIVPCIVGQEASPDGPLSAHLRAHHYNNCTPYRCEECGYRNALQWKVRWHISVRHAAKADRCVVSQVRRPAFNLFLRKYFHNAMNLPPDDEESDLTAIGQKRVFRSPNETVKRARKV